MGNVGIIILYIALDLVRSTEVLLMNRRGYYKSRGQSKIFSFKKDGHERKQNFLGDDLGISCIPDTCSVL